MDNNTDLEIQVIKKFVIKRKRDRYIPMIQKPKDRPNFLGQLAHFNDLIESDFVEIKGANELEQIKKHIGSLAKTGKCYAISENQELDGKIVDIDVALNETIGHSGGTFLVFGKAQILYYEGEGPSNRWISKNKKNLL